MLDETGQSGNEQVRAALERMLDEQDKAIATRPLLAPLVFLSGDREPEAEDILFADEDFLREEDVLSDEEKQIMDQLLIGSSR